MRDCTIEVETLSAVLRKTAHLKLLKKSEEIGQLIAKKSIRQKEKRSQNPLLLFPSFPVVVEWNKDLSVALIFWESAMLKQGLI